MKGDERRRYARGKKIDGKGRRCGALYRFICVCWTIVVELNKEIINRWCELLHTLGKEEDNKIKEQYKAKEMNIIATVNRHTLYIFPYPSAQPLFPGAILVLQQKNTMTERRQKRIMRRGRKRKKIPKYGG